MGWCWEWPWPWSWAWLDHSWATTAIASGAIISVLCLLVVYFLGYYDDSLPTSKSATSHHWCSLNRPTTLPYNALCSVCEMLMLLNTGQYCDKCSLSACRGCKRKAANRFRCKTIVASKKTTFLHHWVKASENASCDTCNDRSVVNSKNNFFCCWCHRIHHCDSTNPPPEEECDFGPMRLSVIPPRCVTVSRKGVVSVEAPDWKNWRPLIVIANPESGGRAGEEILSAFRSYLNPIQVVRLNRNTFSYLRWLPTAARILVAGGDGSVSAALSFVTELNLNPEPHVGVLPLGTGNDLSRVLGWGPACPAPLKPLSIIKDVYCSLPREIDRWAIDVGKKRFYAYNYMSIGVDAKVALDFHKARKHPLYLCGGQTLNYLIYLVLGTHQVMSQDCSGLEKLIELVVDGRNVELPQLQALLLLNIPSWGAGVDVWNNGAVDVPVQSMNDQKFEVVGINSSFHIAQLQVGLSQPLRIMQGSEAKIKLKAKAPMQIDGEPWEQSACEITMKYCGSSAVLIRSRSD